MKTHTLIHNQTFSKPFSCHVDLISAARFLILSFHWNCHCGSYQLAFVVDQRTFWMFVLCVDSESTRKHLVYLKSGVGWTRTSQVPRPTCYFHNALYVKPLRKLEIMNLAKWVPLLTFSWAWIVSNKKYLRNGPLLVGWPTVLLCDWSDLQNPI